MITDLNSGVEDTLREVRELKTRAKNRRDARRYERALKYLDSAAQLATSQLEATPLDLADELADIYGMMGGIHRRQADDASDVGDDAARHDCLRRSIDAYDKGFEYERGDSGLINSYNLVNRLVSRILDQPTVLVGAPLQGDPLVGEDAMDNELEHAFHVVDKQLAESRRGDAWAMADQALLSMLLSTTATARAAYGPLHSTSPPSYVYASALSTLRPLANVASEFRPELAVAVRDLASRLDE